MIELYTKPDCPHCVSAKHQLQAMGIDYVEKNIAVESSQREFLLQEGHKSVPQIYVNGKCIRGGYNTLQKMSKSEIINFKG